MEEKKLSAFDIFSPKQVFLGGMVLGLLVICTIGFFVLLPGALGGGVYAREAALAPTVADNYPTAPSPSAVTVAPVTDADHVKGGKRAKVTLIEYSDFECPFCGRFAPTVKQVIDTYGDDVRVVYRHFPLSFHPQAQPAAVASECAAEQGKFWEYHDGLFENQATLGSATFSRIAQNVGLNVGKFESCLSSGKYDQAVQDDLASGTAAGVGGTPHSILLSEDGQTLPISGALPFDQVAAAIDSLLR